MSGAAMPDFCNRLQKPKKHIQIAEAVFFPLYLGAWWGSENPQRCFFCSQYLTANGTNIPIANASKPFWQLIYHDFL